mgnify:CR=1 FL=1
MKIGMLAEANPTLSFPLLEAVSRRYRQSQALLALMGLRRVEERVRGFLELLALDYGQHCDEGLRLDLRLTHQEVASALGTTRVTVTRFWPLSSARSAWVRRSGSS